MSDHAQPVPGDHLREYSPDPRRGEEIEQKSPGERAEAVEPRPSRVRWIGLGAGLLGAVLVYFVLPGDLAHAARFTAAVAVLMGVWWMTEALPIPATALIPLVAFPVFISKVSVDDVGAKYGDDIIFLFMGGFLLALAMQRWNLHRRIALVTVKLVGTKPTRMIAGFMLATGFLSMWVSNTATAVMMLPIGVSVLALVTGFTKDAATAGARDDGEAAEDRTGESKTGESTTGESTTDGDGTGDTPGDVSETLLRSNFGTALMLGIAYAASVGSLATIIGTPPNTLLVGYLEDNFDISIGFGQWMMAGLPLAAVFLVIVWYLLTHVLFRPEIDKIPGGRELIRSELDKLGPLSSGEIRVGIMFALAALSWVSVPLIWDEPPISDAGIAMTVGVLLFLLPGGAARGVRLLDWETAKQLPWGVLLLFGGGLALSAQFSSSGLTKWIGTQAEGLGSVPIVITVLVVCAGVTFLTELTSNTATAATFLPVAGGVAMGIGADPLLLAIPVALAATCAFMLPVSTPPNAVAYGSGYVTIGSMIKGGIWLNLIGIVLVTLTTFTLMAWALGIQV